jgi:hypothetical protein
LLGKKRNHFAAAGALIASISLLAFSGQDKPASQALVEVNHQEMPLLQSFDYDLALNYNSCELSLDVGLDKPMFASLSNQLIPVTACPQQVCKPEPTHHFSLADTYMAYDMRESFLQR